MSTTVGLKLEPLDVLFFRDGRPFGSPRGAGAGCPSADLAGAWTALLERRAATFANWRNGFASAPADSTRRLRSRRGGLIASLAARSLAGPATGTGGTLEVLVPAPSVLQAEKGTQEKTRAPPLASLAPDRLPGWRAAGILARLVAAVAPAPAPTQPVSGRYLSSAALDAFLQGAPVRLEQLVQSGDLFELDDRTGIGIDPDASRRKKD